MTVCKFFQQGYCRFGQNCRYDHIYGSKYSYHASAQPQAAPAPPQTGALTDEQLIQVQSEVQSVLRGGQWILSCFAPFKEKPIFPGILDLSPEEARLFIYEAKANNNVDQAVAYMNNLFKEARQKYEQLVKPNLDIIKILKSLNKGEVVTSSPFGTTQGAFSNNATGTTASSLFRSAAQTAPLNQTAAQNTAQSIFNQAQNSIFNSQPQDPAKDLFSRANMNTFQTNQNVPQNTAQSIFNQAQNTFFNSQPQDPAIDPFSRANNTFQTSQNAPSPFASQNSAKSIFASAAQNAFSTNQSPSSVFAAANQNIFAAEPSQNTSPFSQNNVFQKDNRVSGFGQCNVSQSEDPGVHSKMEDLTEDDLKAFESDSFQLGLVPEIPPPSSLCKGVITQAIF